jgi:HAD superfamily hydrolase (TIGR01458 family)
MSIPHRRAHVLRRVIEERPLEQTRGSRVSAALLDIQGTLLGGDGSALAGAATAVERLRASGLAVRFVTNIDSVAVSTIVKRLLAAGIPAEPEEIFSPVSAAVRFLSRQERTRCHLLVPTAIESEFSAFAAAGDSVDWVVVGDCREGFTYERLNEAFRHVRNGAEILALQKGRWFVGAEGPQLDTGSFVAALEFGANKSSRVVGKPSMELMRMALADVVDDAYEAVMVGDDVCSDVPGAHAAGTRSVLVRTGKFSLAALERSEHKPDILLDSVADLPDALAELAG